MGYTEDGKKREENSELKFHFDELRRVFEVLREDIGLSFVVLYSSQIEMFSDDDEEINSMPNDSKCK